MLHARDIRYRHAVYEIDNALWAVPIDHPLDDANEPIVDRREVPNTFVRLSDDLDAACRELALRIRLDEWHYQIEVHQLLVKMGAKAFLVVKGREADALVTAGLERHVETLNIPRDFSKYVDYDRWFLDQRAMGRAKHLAKFDELEGLVETEAARFFVYRVS